MSLRILTAAIPLCAFAAPRILGAQSTHRAASPIEHLVVIFDENNAFDHYFGTYPVAANPPGEPRFVALPHTPHVHGLTPALRTHNPNLDPANGAGATNPFRLDRTQAFTVDQSHAYIPEQEAYDGGKMDLFPKYTGRAQSGGAGAFGTRGLVMGYYDGNTVTALWRYAQRFAMNDNSFGDQYGPSTPGAIDLASGQTNGVTFVGGDAGKYGVHDGQGGYTLIDDVDPAGDVCSRAGRQAKMSGRNIGDLLNQHDITWGWFQGGFDLTVTNPNGTTGCARTSTSPILNGNRHDYVPHHDPFQYYAATANLAHHRPISVDLIGTSHDSANHQYDLHDFFDAARAGHLPAVSFLKPPEYQNGHASDSDPLDEQHFLVTVINFLQQLPEWAHTAVIIAYDDSDGWYDHVMAPITNGSFDSTADRLSGRGRCGVPGKTRVLRGVASDRPVNGRCGPGTRQPFMVVSPWARRNYVDHHETRQSSISHFIEDTWLGGERIGGGSFDASAGSILGMFDFRARPRLDPLFLDPETGDVLKAPPHS